jgi:hypothetical protein
MVSSVPAFVALWGGVGSPGRLRRCQRQVNLVRRKNLLTCGVPHSRLACTIVKPRLRLVLVLCLFGEFAFLGWDFFHKSTISSVGGLYFFDRVELSIPRFKQWDERWRLDPLGSTSSTLGKEGCAVTSAAMVLNFYGMPTDPKCLNTFLTLNQGYTDRGWIHWEKAAEFLPNQVQHAYEDLPSYFLIDWNLLNGNPVIVRLKTSEGTKHFVVIVGKEGYSYLIADPGNGFDKGVYPLHELTFEIEALRYYKRLAVL